MSGQSTGRLYAWLLTASLVIPGALIIVALTRWRLRRGAQHPLRVSVAEVGMVLLTLPWVLMILQPASPPPGSHTAYLIPFSDLRTQFTSYTFDNLAVQIVGNLLVLFGFGLLAPLRWRSMASPALLFSAGIAIALTLEILQHVLAAGRVFSVDDVLVNALGAVLGGLATRGAAARVPVAAVQTGD